MVIGEECLFEFAGSESSVVVWIVAGNEEFNFFTGWEYADSGEAVSEVRNADGTSEIAIEDLEGISEVKVALEGERGLVGLKFTLVVNHVTEAIDELVFFVQMEERLSAWGKSWVGEGITHWRRMSVRRGRAFSEGLSMSFWGGEACCRSTLGVGAGGIVSSLKGRRLGGTCHGSAELLG